MRSKSATHTPDPQKAAGELVERLCEMDRAIKQRTFQLDGLGRAEFMTTVAAYACPRVNLPAGRHLRVDCRRRDWAAFCAGVAMDALVTYDERPRRPLSAEPFQHELRQRQYAHHIEQMLDLLEVLDADVLDLLPDDFDFIERGCAVGLPLPRADRGD